MVQVFGNFTLLITGAEGYIGSFLVKYFQKKYKVIPFTENINDALSLPKCDVIIHCAGRIPRDGMEIMEFVRDNVEASHNLAIIAKGTPIIFISTMAVYSHHAYGISRLLGEYILKEYHRQTKVLRLPRIVDGYTEENDVAMSLETMAKKVEEMI